MKTSSALFLMAVLAVTSFAMATQVSDQGNATFDSDLNAPANFTLDSFDTTLGTLNWVRIDITHSAGVSISGDNDDLYKTGSAQARMIRAFDVTGASLATSGGKTTNGGLVPFAVENGDGDAFDSSAPDGYSWGVLSYINWSDGSFFPDMTGYQTAGAGTVGFTVTPTAMVNDLQWVATPDAWKLDVQNPTLDVVVKVTYDYTPTPEPATLALLGMSVVGLVARRRRA